MTEALEPALDRVKQMLFRPFDLAKNSLFRFRLALGLIGLATMLLPVLGFKRAYPLYYLAQYGSLFNVFPMPSAPPP